MEKRYIEDGTLRLEWRDFPYFGEDSVRAAVAARAADEQGKFWEYHDVLYANGGPFDDASLLRHAEEAGLDVKRFEKEYESGRYEAVVEEVFRQGQQAGIPGTPMFFINGEPIAGTQSVEVYAEAIEKARDESESG